uniref:Invertase n=1 Tax=Cyamopsis tetragonoloba TaxID=3832 RepID=A0A678QGP5_CYATE|nr:invertase [Cyamopsis tetragonoloba]
MLLALFGAINGFFGDLTHFLRKGSERFFGMGKF